MSAALLEKLEHDALQLDRNEMIILAEKLRDKAMDQEEAAIEREWIELSKARLEAFDRGEVESIDGEKVMAEAYARCRRNR